MRLWYVGLGLAAGAVFQPVGAQGVDTSRAKPDTAQLRARLDSVKAKARADSIEHARQDSVQKADTIRAPLAHANVPLLLKSDQALHFDRAQLFATGALTLQDLFARVGIATPMSAGYVSSPGNVAVGGDFRRTRVFVDDIEYDALDSRSNGLVDYSQIPIWSAEDVTIERTAAEIRVHLRTWRVDHLAPYTRTDIGTGDQQLNLYRGFFGKRFTNGLSLQLAAQQYGTNPPLYLGGSADQLGLVGRFGWARDGYSVDGYWTHVSRHRGVILAYGRNDSIPGLESTRGDSYLRFGFKDPDTSSMWAQAIVSHSSYNFNPTGAAPVTTITPVTATPTAPDSIKRDTTQAEVQYVATAGINRGPFRLSATARIRHLDTVTYATPALAGSYAAGRLVVRGNIEGKSIDSLSRADLAGEFQIGSAFRVGSAVDRLVDHRKEANGLTSIDTRAWGGVRLGSMWVDGGVIRRDTAALIAPTLFGAKGTTFDPWALGLTLHAAGPIWNIISADVSAIRWTDTTAIYRPQYQTRSELIAQTTLPERFPKGDFGLMLSVRHEYRSASLLPVGTPKPLRASGSHELGTLLEIRIYSAVVSWQVRDVIGSRNYQAPDYLQTRTANFYGVRWEFWN